MRFYFVPLLGHWEWFSCIDNSLSTTLKIFFLFFFLFFVTEIDFLFLLHIKSSRSTRVKRLYILRLSAINQYRRGRVKSAAKTIYIKLGKLSNKNNQQCLTYCRPLTWLVSCGWVIGKASWGWNRGQRIQWTYIQNKTMIPSKFLAWGQVSDKPEKNTDNWLLLPFSFSQQHNTEGSNDIFPMLLLLVNINKTGIIWWASLSSTLSTNGISKLSTNGISKLSTNGIRTIGFIRTKLLTIFTTHPWQTLWVVAILFLKSAREKT